MYITLKSYLERLEEIESTRPVSERRAVPTLTELASDVGMHRISFLRIANNQIGKLDLGKAGGIIAALRRRGFSMDVGDLLEYRD